jgi:streptogramin lyase
MAHPPTSHSTRLRRRRLATALLAVCTLSSTLIALTASAAHAWELIRIVNVQYGSPFDGARDCNGVDVASGVVIPVTIDAIFLGDHSPVGPYATAGWSGGFGSSDDHFGTGVAKSRKQTFHILLRASWDYYGPGTYAGWVHVQDVGTDPSWDDRYNLPIEINAPAPTSSPAIVKCKPIQDGLKWLGDSIKGAMIGKATGYVLEAVCPICDKLSGYYDTADMLSENLDTLMNDGFEHDPPDANYQVLAAPDPPPAPPLPTGLDAAQQTAFTNLDNQLISGIGYARALRTTINRVWGADNAVDQAWHAQQLAHASTLANQLANVFRALPGLLAAAQAVLPSGVPTTAITPDMIRDFAENSVGFTPSQITTLNALGVSPADQQLMADNRRAVNLQTLVDPNPATLFSFDASTYNRLVSSLSGYAIWAGGAATSDPPIVTDITPASGPAGGWNTIQLHGANLASVTGVNFGPSNPSVGQSPIVYCRETSCDVTVPPGHGIVDVVAVGPGGPSKPSADTRYSYVLPPGPSITRIYPPSGGMNDLTTRVTIWGSHLAGGLVRFGPAAAYQWGCSEDMCTAYPDKSTSNMTVDVTVTTDAGTSAITPAGQFTYVATPPVQPAPTVTAVSPPSGSALGTDNVVISGTHLTGAQTVRFGTQPATSYAVVDDSHIQATTPSGAGIVDVTVTTNAGTSPATAADHFTYGSATAPAITGVSPTVGPVGGGTQVVITGTHLTNGSIMFGSEFVWSATCTATSCIATAPKAVAAGTVDIQISVIGAGDSAPTPLDHFTYVSPGAPAVTGVTPASGPSDGGQRVVVRGANLGGGIVSFGGTPDPDTECSASLCAATTPAHAVGTVDVTVTTPVGTSPVVSSDHYDYAVPPVPAVTGVAPARIPVGEPATVVVTGNDLNNGVVSFTASGQPGRQSYNGHCEETMCIVEAPFDTDAGDNDVTVTTPGGTSATSAADRVTFVQPVVTSISPNTGYVTGGTKVTVHGIDLEGGVVAFDRFPVDDSHCTATVCTATAPKTRNPGVVDVQVQLEGWPWSPVTPADEFTYTAVPVPAITGVSPNTGTHDGGDVVTITGTALTGATFRFGIVPAINVSCTDTACTLRTQRASNGTVHVTATTPGGTSATTAADQFTYADPARPVVTAVVPATGSTAGGTSVTVTGTALTAATIYFGTKLVTPIDCTFSSCSVSAPALTAQVVDVKAHTSGGDSALTNADKFTFVNPPVPTITGISPSSSPASGGTAVTVTGTDLVGAAVKFGTNPALNPKCGDTSCTVVAPPGGAGLVDVRVTTNGGTSAISNADHFTYSRVNLVETPIAKAFDGGHLVLASDGNVWFTIPKLGALATIDANGSVTTVPALDTGGFPIGIAAGPDGRTWYAEENPNKLVARDGAGNETAYPLPGVAADVRDLRNGPDGRLWFTLSDSAAIGAITTGGSVSTYPIPDIGAGPHNLVAGPDGRMWFTEAGAPRIGAITMTGVVTEYPLPDTSETAYDIGVGPDARLWFTEHDSIGAISVDGHVHDYPLPDDIGAPLGVTVGPDARMWFTTLGVDQLNALTPATGQVASYPLPAGVAAGHGPLYLLSVNSRLYVTERTHGAIVTVDGITAAGGPAITAVDPPSGPATGGTSVTLTGANLSGTTSVVFGTTPSPSFTVVDANHITATAPAGSGTVHVSVTNAVGTSAMNDADRFTYPSPGGAAPAVTVVAPWSGTGGTPVTILGQGFTGATAVHFGDVAAATFTVTDDAHIVVTAPEGSGNVDVTVTTPKGTSANVAADTFVYIDPNTVAPIVGSVSPAAGSRLGGTAVTVTGSGFTNATAVFFGTKAAVFTITDGTHIAATAPAATPGAVDVRVVTPAGTSAVAVPDDRFTYLAPDDNQAPVPAVTAPATITSLAVAFRVTWRATDASGIAHYDVQRQVTAWNANPALWTSWLTNTTATATTYAGGYGNTYCFRVRAQDGAGNLSAWSAPRCTAVPLKSSQLSYSAGWARHTLSAVFGGVYVSTASHGAKATRTGIRARHLYLIVSTCPTCGTVAVRWNGALLKTVNLHAATTRRKQVVDLAGFTGLRTGTLTITDVGPSGKPIIIEGLAVLGH